MFPGLLYMPALTAQSPIAVAKKKKKKGKKTKKKGKKA